MKRDILLPLALMTVAAVVGWESGLACGLMVADLADTEPSIVPACDPSRGIYQVNELLERMRAGAVMTACDAAVVDELRDEAGAWAYRAGQAAECSEELDACERGQWDAAEYVSFHEDYLGETPLPLTRPRPFERPPPAPEEFAAPILAPIRPWSRRQS